ncbi:hypothetical protein WJX74_008221 [Apatococcus lobatus]|uniref:Cation efflux protein transmembrane domain-containing protein n=1 Tax=Apatococcus lobatus TaxID=904363 RepID=A0AAW1SAU0_9CHLO
MRSVHPWPSKQEDQDHMKRRAKALELADASGLMPPSPLLSADESKAYTRELHTVNVAMWANLTICVAKMVTYTISGSNAMLAEAVHSLGDVLNQAFLRTGIMKSHRAPTALHPYGYHRDKFIWSLIAAVGIFCIGAGVNIVQGLNALFAEKQLDFLRANLAVLGVSGIVEGYSLWVAVRSVNQGAQAAGLTFREFVKRGMDPTSIAVMMEDAAAVAGLFLAGISTWLAHSTGQSFYDAIGTISVGALLGLTALFLVQKNRQLLLGRAMNQKDTDKVLKYLAEDPVIRAVYDHKSEEIGPGIYRFKAEIDFSGEAIVSRHMDRLGREQLYEQVDTALTFGDAKYKNLNLILKAYGKDMMGALGAEIDRIETGIQKLVPGIRHIDLEADRGRHRPNESGAQVYSQVYLTASSGNSTSTIPSGAY